MSDGFTGRREASDGFAGRREASDAFLRAADRRPAPAFQAGFAPRHAAAARAVAQAVARAPLAGFAAAAPGARPPAPPATPEGPRHYAPANPGHDATDGWNPLDPQVAPDAVLPAHEAADAAREEGYAAGLSAGLAQAAARDAAMLADLAGRLDARIDRDRLAERLRATVLALVTRMVGETGVSPERLAERVRAAAAMLADEAESAILRVHPADVDMLAGLLPDTIFPIGDPNVERGGFALESRSTFVEDGPALWLGQLAEQLDRAALPPVSPPPVPPAPVSPPPVPPPPVSLRAAA